MLPKWQQSLRCDVMMYKPSIVSSTHIPAAMHSIRSSSPCRTRMEVVDLVGDSQVGAASDTVRAVDTTRIGVMHDPMNNPNPVTF